METGLQQMLEHLGLDNEKTIRKVLENCSVSSGEDISAAVDLIVQRAVVQEKFGSDAAKLCDIVIQNEKNSSEESQFRKILLTELQTEYRHLRSPGNNMPLAKWLGFVSFLGSVFRYVRIMGSAMHALVAPLLEILGALTVIENNAAVNQEVVQCVVTQLQLCGRELEELNEAGMAELFCDIRDMLLSANTTQFSRLMLLELVELRANSWTLSPSAKSYYYDDIGQQ